MKGLACWFRGHGWVERKPHHMWSLNTFECTRCGVVRIAGFDGRGLDDSQGKSAHRKALHEAQKQYLKGRK